MAQILLLAVLAVWAAVLIPPLVRSRVENRPNSSVSDFRRQLSTLQRAVPTRTMSPMRSMGRPLAPTSLPRQGAQHRPTQSYGAPLARTAAQPYRTHSNVQEATIDRRPGQPQQVRQQHLHRVSQRELLRRRRANVLFILIAANLVTLFLAASTKSHAMVYAFALVFVCACVYCYRLVQLRNYELDRQYSEHNWFNAA